MGSPQFKELTDSQRHTYQDAVELYRAYLEAVRQNRRFKGGMHWKKIRGREYLYRYRDRYGHGGSLGPRSPQTEQVLGDFSRQRQALAARLQGLRLRLAEQARFCRAALIHQVPQAVVKVLRRLEQHDWGQNLLVIGATALYAYEFAAGVFGQDAARRGLPAEAHHCLDLVGDGRIDWGELLRLLRQGDRSMASVPGAGCRAVNRDGFLVRLFKTDASRPGRQKAVTVPGARAPLPPEAGQLQYLAASPKLSPVVISQDGLPATLVVPDPRAFALHRLWLSQQADRDENQRTRDLSQALAVAELVLRYLPQYDFSPSELEMFPGDLLRDAEGDAEELIEDEIIR